MDKKTEERLLQWYDELDSNDELNDDTEVTESEYLHLESEQEEPFLSSGSEYQPSGSEFDGNQSENGSNSEDEEVSAPLPPQDSQAQQINHWMDVDGSSLKQFLFTGSSKINIVNHMEPAELYRHIVDDTILDMIVQETNRNARRHNTKWKDVSIDELEVFFAIILYMGLVSYPKISDYWSKKFLYRHCFVRHVMARNRFQCILRFIHFSDNETADKQDRLSKVRPLVEALTKIFKDLKDPPEVMSIDESMVPFRGRLLFLQYIPGKASKYGVKIFKLCDETGYTYETQVYSGKSNTNTAGRHSNNVVLNLLKDYLDQGRTLVADNFYNNMELANILLQRKTHNVGTLRKNTKGVPKDVSDDKKMKKGEIKGKECKGIVVGHWKDKRSVRFITTRHTLRMTEARKRNRKGEVVYKPEAIIFYNKYKMGVDISDQMSSYFSVLRRTIRWYHKVAFEYLFGTAVVNALLLYQTLTSKKIQIADFREQLVMGLLRNVIDKNKENKKIKHKLEDTEERTVDNRKKRKRCVSCYEKQYSLLKDSRMAAKKTKLISTFCRECPNSPSLCLECFQKNH